MLQLAFHSLICAIVLGVGLAEAPHHGHGQLQAEVSEDGRVLMRETRETEDPDEEALVGHEEEEEQGREDTPAQAEKEPSDAEDWTPETDLEDDEDPAHPLDDAHQADLLQDAEEEHVLFDTTGKCCSRRRCWCHRRRRSRRRRARRRRARRRAIPCAWGGWGGWSKCSKNCGTGAQSRNRGIARHAAHGGKGCSGASKETRKCNTQHCPVHCVWKPFSAWTKCSKSCAGGEQKRTRGVKTKAAHGGNACKGAAEEKKKCNEQACPVDCVYAEWGDWGDCSVTCGNGTRKHSREVETEAKHGGAKCEGEKEEEGECDPVPEKCGAWRQAVGAILSALMLYLW